MSVGRNDPCPCQSGKKYKQCCGKSTPQALTPILTGAQIAALLQQSVAHFQAQRWPQAEQCCLQILAAHPQHADTLYALGSILLQQGKKQAAAELLAQAVHYATPPTAAMHLRRGLALRLLGKPTEAVASLQQALALQAGNPDILFQLGQALDEQGNADAAIASLQQAVALRPGHVEAWNKLAQLQQQRGQGDAAVASYRQALAAQPQSFPLLSNLGSLLLIQGQLTEATPVFRQALALQPQSAAILNNLGTCLLALSRSDEAIACFRQLLTQTPESHQALSNLGSALLLRGQTGEAITCLRRALALNPDDASAHSSLLFSLQYQYGCTAQDLLDESRRFAARFETPLKAQWPEHRNDRNPERRLKIGYVSPDLREHAVAWFIEPILARHDHARVEVFCYYNNVVHDAVSGRLRAFADHWLPCRNLSDTELAERIQADGIDILVDLAGHSALSRLLTFARKPAPVQVAWVGNPGTTGLAAMDYRFTDARLDPEGLADPWHTEALLRLPASVSFQPAAASPPVNDLPALQSGQLMIRLWARILTALPGARLMLGNVSEPSVADYLHSLFAETGIGPERLRFMPKLPLHDYLALHHEIDLALDPFPFGGGATTHHSLWMGVPVVTLAGDTTLSRQGAAILTAAGLGEFIAHSEEEYVERVLVLAADLPRLQATRQSLRQNMVAGVSPEELTRSVEQAYADIWKEWCASRGALRAADSP